MRNMPEFRFISRKRSHPGICLSIDTFYSVKGIVSEQRRPWLDCAIAQANLGSRWLHKRRWQLKQINYTHI